MDITWVLYRYCWLQTHQLKCSVLYSLTVDTQKTLIEANMCVSSESVFHWMLIPGFSEASPLSRDCKNFRNEISDAGLSVVYCNFSSVSPSEMLRLHLIVSDLTKCLMFIIIWMFLSDNEINAHTSGCSLVTQHQNSQSMVPVFLKVPVAASSFPRDDVDKWAGLWLLHDKPCRNVCCSSCLYLTLTLFLKTKK